MEFIELELTIEDPIELELSIDEPINIYPAGFYATLKGKDGSDGVSPTVEVGTTTTGEPGTVANVENTGTESEVVLAFTIPKGSPGNDGTPAAIEVGTVTTYEPGTPATVENTGTESNVVLNFGIPKGDKGDTGNPGIVIPKLQLEVGFHKTTIPNPKNDTLKAFFHSSNLDFLNYNPEIWLFRPKRHNRYQTTLAPVFIPTFEEGWVIENETDIDLGFVRFTDEENPGSMIYTIPAEDIDRDAYYNIKYDVVINYGAMQSFFSDILLKIPVNSGTYSQIMFFGGERKVVPRVSFTINGASDITISNVSVSKVTAISYTRKRKWTHEPHLLGLNSASPAYNTTQFINCPVQEIALTGRHTEFPLTITASGEKQIVAIDPYEWAIAKSAIDDSWFKCTEETPPDDITQMKIFGRRNLSQPFKIALVIDNPLFDQLNPGVVCPKLIGELSDTFYLRRKPEQAVNNMSFETCQSK